MSWKQSQIIAAESSPVNQLELAQKPDTASTDEKSSKNGDEMLDALQKRQEKIENLKELKQIQDKINADNLNSKKLDALQKLNLNIENLEELQELQKIVNNDSLDGYEMLDALKEKQINIESIEELKKIKRIVNNGNPNTSESVKLSKPFAFKLLTVGLPATILVILVATPFTKGLISVVTSNFQERFAKPPIPERSLYLHNDAFNELSNIGRKAQKINDDKFTSEEFKLLIQIKVDIAKGIEGYKELNYRVELLRAALIAQKSFLKLEATELRYRSRKQQEFYQYISDNLEDNIDKEAFVKKIKKKQTEILPLINTEEGREAINSYAQEMNIISKHELGLKLLALFKQYDLTDFSIIKEISDVIESLQGHDLLTPKRLLTSVKEYYDLFEKIAPILSISKEESSPATYARILQVVGLIHRHGEAYQQFKELIRLLHKWENPYETVTMVREQYSSRDHKIPPEFTQEILGITIYQKYAKYLPDL
ncbi:hypothetical protein [Pleurocapsa sp. PCC 7319]|uniref:hypothetical protein n=1 Tax=Pleurocapsa sp. PCC 7319 TaxID=118161 RepID=UPI001181A659|nr:hypothetical protein [Pleurocapsa sp. PCC 7319]